jgi:hypothetical protein
VSIFLVQVALDFHIFAPNTMSFIPVQFNPPDIAIGESDVSDAFQLSPSARAIGLLQVRQNMDAAANRNGLDVFYLADNLELHSGSLARTRQFDNLFGLMSCSFVTLAAWWAT